MWRPVSEDELHLYVDGFLARLRAVDVEAHLDANPDEAERIAAYSHLNAMLRELGLAIEDALPRAGAMRLRRVIAEHGARQGRRKRAGAVAAMTVLAAALGIAGIEARHAKGGTTIVAAAAIAPAHARPAGVEPAALLRRAP